MSPGASSASEDSEDEEELNELQALQDELAALRSVLGEAYREVGGDGNRIWSPAAAPKPLLPSVAGQKPDQ